MPNNNERIDLSSLPRKPLEDGQQIPDDAEQLAAAFMACKWVVRSYQQAGFTAHNTRNRIQQRMDDAQRGGLWDRKHYKYVAALYREAILAEYGEHVRFRGQ